MLYLNYTDISGTILRLKQNQYLIQGFKFGEDFLSNLYCGFTFFLLVFQEICSEILTCGYQILQMLTWLARLL